MESGWERDVKIHKGLDLCLYGTGGGHGSGVGGGGIDDSDGGGGVDGSGGNSAVGDGGESVVYRRVGDGGSVGDGLCRS